MKRSDDKLCNSGNQIFGKTKVFFYVKASICFPVQSFYRHSSNLTAL